MRFFAAAIARRSKEAIRRAIASTKPSSSASGRARLTYPYRPAVSPSKSFAPRTISSARPQTDQMWEAFRAAAAGMHSDSDFRVAQSRVLARREAHVAGEDELAARAADAASDLRDADHRRFGETDERVHQDRQAGRPDSSEDVPRLAGQIEVREVELRIRTFEYYDTQARAGVHSSEQILQAFEDGGVDNVEGWIVEDNPPVRGRFLDDPHG